MFYASPASDSREADPSGCGCADGRALPARWKKCAAILKRNSRRNSFSSLTLAIALRKFSFYLRNKTTRRHGTSASNFSSESQDMVNQFSFWPRYEINLLS